MNIQFLNEGSNNVMTWVFVALLVVLVVALLVVPMFTNKKRAKQTMDLHNSLRPGDVIKTVGGIIGTIKEVRQISPNEKQMLIESGEGDNKTSMWLDIQALYQVISRADAPAADVPAIADPAEVAPADTDSAPVEPAEQAATTVPTEEPVADHLAEEQAATAVSTEEPAAAEQPAEEQAAAAVSTEESVNPAENDAPASTQPAPAKPKAVTHAKKKPVAGKSNSTKK